jgi:hypothetical protein
VEDRLRVTRKTTGAGRRDVDETASNHQGQPVVNIRNSQLKGPR